MDPNQLTQKTQEALHDAQTKALRYGHTEVDVEHLLLALLDQPEGLVPRLLERAGRRPTALQADIERDLAAPAARERPGRAPGEGMSRARSHRCSTRPSRRRQRLKDEYVSVEHVVLAMLASGGRRPPDGCSRSTASTPRALPRGADPGARQPARDERDAGDGLRGAREVRPRPRRGGAQRTSSTR